MFYFYRCNTLKIKNIYFVPIFPLGGRVCCFFFGRDPSHDFKIKEKDGEQKEEREQWEAQPELWVNTRGESFHSNSLTSSTSHWFL